MKTGAQNMKIGPDALATAEKVSGNIRHEDGTRRPPHRRKSVRERKTLKRDPTPSLSSKMSSGAQIIKTVPDALGTAENEF
jgi:hypothetical protein